MKHKQILLNGLHYAVFTVNKHLFKVSWFIWSIKLETTCIVFAKKKKNYYWSLKCDKFRFAWRSINWLTTVHISIITRRFSNHVSRLLSRSHTFAIIVILDLKIHQSMWIHWPFFPKTWTKGHWPLDDLWPHVCWGHMCDSTQGSLCPSPMTIHQCMWIQWSILQNTTYIHILHTTYYIHTIYILRTEWVIT